jgi:hypothetical protein
MYIYALFDPRNNTPMYVGKTAGLRGRYWQHLKDVEHMHTKKTEWLFTLWVLKLKPIMKEICCIDYDEANECERMWIRKFQKRYPLVNSDRRGFKTLYSSIFVNRCLMHSKVHSLVLKHHPLKSFTEFGWQNCPDAIISKSIKWHTL